MTLYDNSLVTNSDLNSNFFCVEEDINKITRAEASKRGLNLLNNLAQINVFKGELANNFQILDDYKVIIISELINLETAENLNIYCRNKKINFIYTCALGFSGFIFNDFGEDFIIFDSNGEEAKKYFIRNISNSSPGIVVIDNSIDHRNIELGNGDFVTFKEVTGMNELNDTPPRPIKILSPTSFTIEDTTKFREYNCNGTVEEVKIPKPGLFKELIHSKNEIYYDEILDEFLNEGCNNLNNSGDNLEFKNSNSDGSFDMNNINNKDSDDSINTDSHKLNSNCNNNENNINFSNPQFDEGKNLQNEKIHLGVLTIHEFFSIHNSLPHKNNKEEIEECILISEKILSNSKENGYKWALNLQNIDKEIISNMVRFSRIHFTSICTFLGGIVAQEIIKVTGKFTPVQQWIHFDFFEVFQYSLNKNNNNVVYQNNIHSRYNEQLSIIGEETNENLKNLKILLIGCNSIGNELLKIFSLLGISSGEKGLITIADDDIIEKVNLNQQFLYNNSDVGQKKIEKCKEILLRNNPDLKIQCLSYKVNQENDNLFTDQFWADQNIIICTLVNKNLIRYIDKKCSLFNKILIFADSYGTKGNYQIIVPNYTSNIKDDFIYEDDFIIDKQFPTSIEQCIDWGRELFEQFFNIDIKELNFLLSSNENNIKQIFDSYLEKKEYNEETLTQIYYFKRILYFAESKNFEDIVDYCIDRFQDLFDFSINEIFEKYPSDLLNDDGTKFWSGAKRQPQNIYFDLKNQKHFLFISTFSILLGKCINYNNISEKFGSIKNIAIKHNFKNYNYKKEKKDNEYYENCVNDFFNFILNSKEKNIKLSEIKFDKLNDQNQHVNFIMSAANIKAENYKIGECDFLKAKTCSGKFQPIIGTVSSTIAGLITLQIISLSQFDLLNCNIPKIENVKNCFLNLGINKYLMTELFPRKIHKDINYGNNIVVKAIPENWKTWDKIKIEKSLTLQEFFNYFYNNYKVKITNVINCHNRSLSSFTEEQLKEKVEKLLNDNDNKCKINLEIKGLTEKNERVEMPYIEYYFKNE